MNADDPQHPQKPPHPPRPHPPLPPPLPTPPSPPQLVPIERVYAIGGDGPAVIVTAIPHGFIPAGGSVILILTLVQPGFFSLNHPYAVTVVSATEFKCQEEDEQNSEAFIPWSDAQFGNGANPGTCVERG
mgnify:CR=1 FL=1